MNAAEIIKGEIERLERQLEKWERERSSLDAKITPARQELTHWNGILELRHGINDTSAQGVQIALPPVGSTPTAEVEEYGAEYGAKTRALRAFLRSRRGGGVTLAELIEECKRFGSRPQVAYRFVERLTKGNTPELEKRGDRIYPTMHLKSE